ncbi:MAG: tRNA epoxyqueuosine(34) reductase QueG [Ignavibacteriales bacterium]|nr:tRNA epoxyqueuosine(34) reductase QueG [Ignavibacteriales bacterium]
MTTDAIKAKARELGFAGVGVARAEHLDNESAHLEEWLRRGFHASMVWMGRDAEKRSDPRFILSSAKSVVCVALNYFVPHRHSTDPERGKISRYAWGDDYHLILDDRLRALEETIKQLYPSAQTRRYVDTGPVMDKAWAVRAGLGWMGKHTNVISKEVGSWIFLGEILTDLELEYDSPLEDFCGTCAACIDACPTQALVEPYVLDSNKCISYLTIEHRGNLADSLTTKFDNWIYGCDICQDVCPWNRFQQPTTEAAFQPREFNLEPKLENVAAMSADEFVERFRKSPIKRTKREGLARNARAVLQASMKESI